MNVFWVVVPNQPTFQRSADDGGNKHHLNVGQILPDCMVHQSRRQSSSFSLPQEYEISQHDAPYLVIFSTPVFR
jgi:hypothetical protein